MKIQYLKLITIWHPDTIRNDFTKPEYEAMSKAINAAYESGDSATLNAIETHGHAYKQHLPPPLPVLDSGRAERDKKWADIMSARAAYDQRSDGVKLGDFFFDPANYSPYLMLEAWQIGWEKNGGRRNAHALITSLTWTLILYSFYQKIPSIEEAAIATFPAHAAGIHVSFVAGQIIALLASLPFLLPMSLIVFMLCAELGLVYLAFLILHTWLAWCSPWIAPLAYLPALAACLVVIRSTLDPWGWR